MTSIHTEGVPSPESEAFARLADELLDFTKQFPGYYYHRGENAQTEEATRILSELEAARSDLAEGRIGKQDHRTVSLFNGRTSRDVGRIDELQNSNLVGELYARLNHLGGHGAGGYHDIFRDAQDLSQTQGLMMSEESPHRYSVGHHRVALSENGQLSGLQFGINDNILVAFRMGSMDPSTSDERHTVVELVVVDPSPISY